MKHPRLLLGAMLLPFLFLSCADNGKDSDPLADSGRTVRTENLNVNLRDIVTELGFLIGQKDATLYGIGWKNEPNRSDIHSVCNDMPAIVAFDITGYSRGDALNADSIAFTTITAAAIDWYDKGGMVAMTGNAADVALLNSLETPYGVKVPVLYMIKENAEKTAEAIEKNDVTNALIASPSDSEKTDVLTISFAFTPENTDSTSLLNEAKELDSKLAALQQTAKTKGKAFGISELTYRGLRYEMFWTQILLPILSKYNISFVIFGSNKNGNNHDFSTPYPGQLTADDFAHFYNSPQTLFRAETPALYTDIKAYRTGNEKKD